MNISNLKYQREHSTNRRIVQKKQAQRKDAPLVNLQNEPRIATTHKKTYATTKPELVSAIEAHTILINPGLESALALFVYSRL